MIKSYSKLMTFSTMIDRVNYLMVQGIVGKETFGAYRYLNQVLYSSDRWKRKRREIIIRDNGNDLSMEGFPIFGPVYIHHINPITVDDVRLQRSCLFDNENLISVSYSTHQMIHYGSDPSNDLRLRDNFNRSDGDTCLWEAIKVCTTYPKTDL